MPPESLSFPIVPTQEEEKRLSQSVSLIRTRTETVAKNLWILHHGEITGFTKTRQWFDLWNKSTSVFDPLADHILKAALLVAWRFGWPPEEILALWQIEGLPCFTGVSRAPDSECKNLERPGISWVSTPIKSTLPEPRGEAEARAFARSIILYQRWGLDALVPVRHDSMRKDNVIRQVRHEEHDEAFEEGFLQQIGSFLPNSPLSYLNDPQRSPIKVKKERGLWVYGTDSEYQTTMLAMQYARFKYLETLFPKELKVRGVTLKLDPPFPAFVRTYYNCDKEQSRRILIDALKHLVSVEVNTLGKLKDQYDSKDLEFIFSHGEPPNFIKRGMRNDYGPGKCYLGGLRFEVLRLTYRTLFYE